jgi:hypothetical protein
MWLMKAQFACAALVYIATSSPTHAESVYVKYHGEVDLAPFSCEQVMRSSFVRRICYDSAKQYMLISLDGTFYHYCSIDGATVDGLRSAPSIGRYYNSVIKGRFDCRLHSPPAYE